MLVVVIIERVGFDLCLERKFRYMKEFIFVYIKIFCVIEESCFFMLFKL